MKHTTQICAKPSNKHYFIIINKHYFKGSVKVTTFPCHDLYVSNLDTKKKKRAP